MTQQTSLSQSAPQADYSRLITPEELRISPLAQQKMAELMVDVDEEILGIRVFVGGGGCSGMQYGMTFTDARTEYDSVFEGEGFAVYVDAVALNYLQGAEIDFVERPTGASFVFRNVFAAVGGSGACGGCGASSRAPAGGGCA